MSSNVRKLDRRLADMSDVATLGTTVDYRDAWGQHEQTFDFADLGLPEDFTALFADAFRSRYAPATPHTRTAVFRHLKFFAKWRVRDKRVTSLADFDTRAFKRYVRWVDTKLLNRNGELYAPNGRRNIVLAVSALFNWAQRNDPERILARLDIPQHIFEQPGPAVTPRTVLPEHDLKAILQACYDEIKVAWAKFEVGRSVLATDQDVAGVDPELAALIRCIHASDDGTVPTGKRMKRFGVCTRVLYGLGGIRRAAEYLHLTTNTLAPFYIALTIQTGANPDPLRLLRRDCLVPHPLDENLVIVEWDKPRAGFLEKHLQRRSFDRRRPYAAPNLVEMLLAMTEPCVRFAKAWDKENLFVIRAEGSKGIYTIPQGTLKYAIERFVPRANERISFWNDVHPAKPRAYLPAIVPSELRRTMASAHYVAAAGDIQHAQTILNHQNVATTERYIGGDAALRLQQQTLSRLQRLMVSWVTSNDSVPADVCTASSDPAETFSHRCLDPLAASSETTDRRCPGLAGCLVCPGLVIPIDAEHLARLLAAKARLEAARERLDPQRWRSLYEPSYQVITNDILPDFPAVLFEEAQSRLPTLPPLIDLE